MKHVPQTTLPDSKDVSSAKQIRGSSLLLAGRGVSLALNFITQVLTVRYLIKQDYGSFAYAISLIELCALATAFALDKTFSRFGAIYHEQGNLKRLNGALIVSSTVILGMGGILPIGYWIGHESLARWWNLSADVQTVLLWLIVLIPVGAFGSLATSFFAVLGETRTVFFRRHLISPGMKCTALIIAIAGQGTLTTVVAAFVISGLIQFVVDLFLVVKFAHQYGLLASLKKERPEYPMRELGGYCLPLLASDAMTMVCGPLVVVLLGTLSGAMASASFRAVMPVIRWSELPAITFSVLFVPLATRLLTRNRPEELKEMFQRTRTWVRVLTFPVFAASVLLAELVLLVLFGREYLDSASLMAVLAVGAYLEAVFGFNVQLLKVLQKMRLVVFTELAGTIVTAALCYGMILNWNAYGAALGVCTGTILHNLLREAVVWRVAPMGTLQESFGPANLCTAGCVVLVVLIRFLVQPPMLVGVALAIGLSWVVLLANRRPLQIENMFPEVGRFPRLRRFLSGVGS